MNDNNDIFVGDDDHAKIPEPLDYRLRAATKRTDLPDDVIRLLADAYYEVWLGRERVRVLQDMHENLLVTKEKLEQERDEARREVCQMVSNADESSKPESIEQVANRRGWDCYKEEQ